MASFWGPTHSLLGCQHLNVSRMVATGFSTMQGMLSTTGMQAFFTFLPLCGELNLYGFGGVSTADGHAESTSLFNLYQEHLIQDKIIVGAWDHLPWRRNFSEEVKWLRANVPKARKIVGTEP